MLKISPHPIDRAIWGALDGAGIQTPPKEIKEDSGQIDLTALIAEAQAELAPKIGGAESAAPASGAHPLLIFPFDPPSAPAPAPPPPVAPEVVVSRFHKIRLRSLVVPGVLIIIGAVLAVMAVGSEPEPVAAASTASASLPTTPAPPPPPSAKQTSAEEVKVEPARPRARAAPSSAPPGGRRPAPSAHPADPCKGDLMCAMKRATERRRPAQR